MERAVPLWSDRIAQDSAILDDFLTWVATRDRDLTASVFARRVSLDEAIGTKKILDELTRCATMNAREEQSNVEFKRAVGAPDQRRK